MRHYPGDDTPRLLAADWLDEQGDDALSAWAMFIRAQIEAARSRRGHVFNESCDCTGCREERAAVRLYDQWGYSWFTHGLASAYGNAAPRIIPPPVDQYSRGFPTFAHVEIQPYRIAAVPRLVAPLFAHTPIPSAVFQLWPGARPFPGQIVRPRPGQLADWVVAVDIKRQPSGFLTIRATITRPVGGTSEMHNVARVAGENDQLPRLIRGAVGQVLRERNRVILAEQRRAAEPAAGNYAGAYAAEAEFSRRARGR
jgi:uncharacterized protein (TIGR02996 family)